MSIETLAANVDHLQKDFDEHKDDDKRNFKYAHNMLEDLLGKHHSFETGMELFRTERVSNATVELAARTMLANMDARLRTVERLSWIAVGGVGVIGALVIVVLNHFMKMIAG